MPPNRATDVATLATGFGRALRGAGLDAPTTGTIDFAASLDLVGLADPAQVFHAGRACYCRRPEDAEIYARTFAAYFGVVVDAVHPGRLTTVPPEIVRQPALAVETDGPDSTEPPDSDDPVPVAWSAQEILRTKDFALCSEAELAEASRLMVELRRHTPVRRGRRLQPSDGARRGTPDVRRTIRSALAAGGEPARLHRRARGERPRRVVLLLDVSGSMRPYARALLRFAHASVVAGRRVEAFTLSTRCTRVTRELAWRDPDAALRRAAAAAPDLEGGTRLGDGMRSFNDTWGVAGLARGAIVVICSDGWDRGEPNVLASEMERLSRVAHRVVWVNPLKASEGYEPLARGMAAALPHVDEFVSGHSLSALGELAEVIAR